MLQLLKRLLGPTTLSRSGLIKGGVDALCTSNVDTSSTSGTSLTTAATSPIRERVSGSLSATRETGPAGVKHTPVAIIPPVECTLRDQIDFVNLVLLLGRKDLLRESLTLLGDTNNYAP